MARGFSLVEMLVVVAIAGVLSALVFPRISDTVIRSRGLAAVVRVEGFMSSARNLARRVNRCVQVERVSATKLVARTYSNATTACPNTAEASITKELDVTGSAISMSPWSNTGSASFLVLNRTGGTALKQEAVMTIDLLHINRTRTLRVLPLLGFVRVE